MAWISILATEIWRKDRITLGMGQNVFVCVAPLSPLPSVGLTSFQIFIAKNKDGDFFAIDRDLNDLNRQEIDRRGRMFKV